MRNPERLGTGPDVSLDQRFPLIVACVLLIFGGFALRLFHLQVLQGEELQGVAEGNALRLVRIEAPRGDIVDRDGRMLATVRPAFGINVLPSELRDRERTLGALAELLGVEFAELDARLGQPTGRRRFQPIRLAGDLTHEQLARIETHLFELAGVHTDARSLRHYVEGTLASHLLGQIGEIGREQLESEAFEGYRSGDVIGKTGVESLMESRLHGTAGGRNVVVDVAGRVVEVLDEIAPTPGARVRLALDLELQRAAEEAFAPPSPEAELQTGALVALDPRNGDVLALASSPAFDPNDFVDGVDAATWKRLTTDALRPLQNRAVSGQYPPGSTYKAFVAAGLLESGLQAPSHEVFCPGSFRFGNRDYRCWKRTGHGSVDLRRALQVSCDVYFYRAGLALGIDRLAAFARGFGLGAKTGIELGHEQSGLIPTEAWKKRRFGESWMLGETVSAAIGQGFNLVTPLQLAVAYAALANGGTVYRPRLVLDPAEGEDSDGRVLGRVPVAAEHLARVRDGLVAVVNEAGGTGGRSRIEGVNVAGKTGTAQVVHLAQTEHLAEHAIPRQYRDHAWFAAFAPAEAPEIAIAVIVEHAGHGGSVAAPVAQRVFEKYFARRRAASERAAPAQAKPGGTTPPSGDGAPPEAAGRAAASGNAGEGDDDVGD